MYFGVFVLLLVTGLIYFGLAQNVLDRLKMNDKAALVFVGLLIVGSFIDLVVYRNGIDVIINIGGAIIPLILVVYIISRAKNTQERTRAGLSVIGTTAVLYLIIKMFQFEEGHTVIDIMYVFPIVAAVIAYILGRSRRSAFIGGITSVLLLDIIYLIELIVRGMPGRVHIGGAGMFDIIIFSGIAALIIAELVGEVRERMAGGSAVEKEEEVTEKVVLETDDGGEENE